MKLWQEAGALALATPIDEIAAAALLSNPKVAIKDIERWANANISLSELAKEDRAYMAKLQDDMEKYGQLRPIDIKINRDGSKYIHDGHHRLIIAKKLGWSKMNVKYVKNPDDLFPDRPLRDYSIEQLEKIYQWTAREKKNASSLGTPDGETRYYRLWDIQTAAWEEIRRKKALNNQHNELHEQNPLSTPAHAFVSIRLKELARQGKIKTIEDGQRALREAWVMARAKGLTKRNPDVGKTIYLIGVAVASLIALRLMAHS